MKITKPSELREGMKVKFKRGGVRFWGWAHEDDEGRSTISGGTGTGLDIGYTEFYHDVTDVESYEGIRAAKEGDVLVNESGEIMVFLSNDFGAITSYADEFKSAAEFDTWEELEEYGYKLKDQEQPAKDKEGAWLRNKVAELIGDLIEYDDYPERRKMFRKVQMDINDEIDRLIELVDIRLGADLSNSSDYSIKTIKIDNKIYKLEPIETNRSEMA